MNGTTLLTRVDEHGAERDDVATHTCIFDDWAELYPWRDAWNDLVRRSPTNEVFSTFEWLEAWSAAGTRNVTLAIVVVFQNNTPAAIAPLMVSDRSVGGITLRTLEFIGTPNVDYSDFIYEDSRLLPTLWRSVSKISGRVDLVSLQQIKESSPTWQFLKSEAGMDVRPCVIGLSTTLPEKPEAPIAEYLKGPGVRPRTLRRIEKEGAVALRLFDSPGDIAANLPTLFSQHIRRWSETKTPSFFAQESTRQMYTYWAERLAGIALLAVLTLDGKPVASLFGFEYNSKLVVHTLAYDPDFKQWHCGLVCVVRVMQILRKRGIHSIDFTRGTERFKSFFAEVPTLSYEAVSTKTLRARLVYGFFLHTKDFTLAHRKLRDLADRFGRAPSGVDPETFSKLASYRRTARGLAKLLMTSANDGICQGERPSAFSKLGIPLKVYRFIWYLRTEGLSVTAKKTADRIMTACGRPPAAQLSRREPFEEVPLNLEPGEWVQIKSEEEILATLDDSARCKGLQFMPQMRHYCGTRARVMKRVEKVLFEESQQRRRIRNTVLLENLICDGDGVGCDRSCFFFWRESWLTRVPQGAESEPTPKVRTRTPALYTIQSSDASGTPAS